jgi:hypothetical protein
MSAVEWCPDGNHRESDDFKKWGCDSWTTKCIGESNSLVEKVIISSFNAG